ncbi:MAG: terminase gpA endonuclease subunit [Pseudomonadota bacterium]
MPGLLQPDTPAYRPGRALPPSRPFGDALAVSLPALAPPARLTVAEVASRRRVKSGGAWIDWDNAVAPYMVEPMEAITSRLVEAVVFAGPARSAKTEALIKCPIAHAVLCAPRLVHVGHMSREAAREWSVEELGPMLANSPELAAAQITAKGGDNTFDKRFRGGARLTVGWPVAKQLSGRDIPTVVFTDYDRQPLDLDGEGSAFALGRKRTTGYGARGITIAESSPGFPIEDESWTPETPHQAAPAPGIAGLYNMGSRARLYWTCPHCDGLFQPSWERLTPGPGSTPAERGRGAVFTCLHCGGVIEEALKRTLNAGAVWLHEGPDGLVPIEEIAEPPAIRSYWLEGPAAAFASWGQLVTRYLEAEEQFEATGDETGLKSVVNTDLGRSYAPRARGMAAGLTAANLREGLTDHAWGRVPASARFVTVAVDVQPNRFVVQAEAWGPRLERWVIDRFDLATVPEGAPRAGARALAPGLYAEDWAALEGLVDRVWPVDGGADGAEGVGLAPVAVVIDCGGADNTFAHACGFWRRMQRTRPKRFFLVRGRGGLDRPRTDFKAPETSRKGKRAVRRDVRILWAGVDRLKDEVAASLMREDDGARALHLPRGAPAEMADEYAAERRGDKGWEKRPGVRRNEALDLSVYALALVVHLGGERINWDRPPAWAVAPDDDNSFARRETPARAEDDDPAPSPSPRRPAARVRRAPGLGGW